MVIVNKGGNTGHNQLIKEGLFFGFATGQYNVSFARIYFIWDWKTIDMNM